MYAAPKGFNDIFPGAEDYLAAPLWHHLINTAQIHLQSFGFIQVLLPIVETTPLFTRGLGDDTDIVSHEMYNFTDRGQRPLTLRPEGTAGAARCFLEHKLDSQQPQQKWFYIGPMFRAERPQKGRYRQFYQLGAESFHAAHPACEAEMLLMLHSLCTALDLPEVTCQLNTLGDAESRGRWQSSLRDHFQKHLTELCPLCQKRFETNVLRILDCKNPACGEVKQAAPDIMAHLSDAARAHWDNLRRLLDQVQVPYVRNSRLVRGLGYYTGTIFELCSAATETTSTLGAQNAIMGGGRYDDLTAQLGGKAVPALGFAAGLERLAILLAAQQRKYPGVCLYLLPMEEAFVPQCFSLAQALRQAGRSVEVDLNLTAGLKHRFRQADRVQARFALVIGQQEIDSGVGKLRNLNESRDVEVTLQPAALSASVKP